MKTTAIILFAVMCFSTVLKSQANRKVPKLGFYPEEYVRFNNNDWDEIKAIYETVLKYDNIDSLRNDFPTVKDAWFLFSRMADIAWNEGQKGVVSDFFQRFALKILNGQSYLKEVDKQKYNDRISSTDPLFFPQAAVWAILSIDFQNGCTAVEKVLEKTSPGIPYQVGLRQKALHFLSRYFKNIGMEACLEKLATYDLSATEQRIINEIQFKHQASRYETESQTWEFLWENSSVKAAANIQDHDAWNVWYQSNLLIKNIFPRPNILEILDLVESSSVVNKKYLLLYSACFFANDYLSSSKELNTGIKDRLTDMVNTFYRKNPSFAQVEEGRVDFLKKSFESFKAK